MTELYIPTYYILKVKRLIHVKGHFVVATSISPSNYREFRALGTKSIRRILDLIERPLADLNSLHKQKVLLALVFEIVKNRALENRPKSCPKLTRPNAVVPDSILIFSTPTGFNAAKMDR